MDLELALKFDTDSLVLIKDESEKLLNSVQNAEAAVTSKSLNIMQVLLSVSVLIFGYIIVDFSTIGKLTAVAASGGYLLIIFGFTIYNLYHNILPYKTTLIGSSPSLLIQDDIIKDEPEAHKRSIIINRLHNVDGDIKNELREYQKKLNKFKLSNQILFIGLFFSPVSFALLFLFLR